MVGDVNNGGSVFYTGNVVKEHFLNMIMNRYPRNLIGVRLDYKKMEMPEHHHFLNRHYNTDKLFILLFPQEEAQS